MMRSRLGKFLLFSFLISLSLFSYSQSFDDYLIYQSDVDGDGDIDFLLKISPEEVEIPYDIKLKRDRSAQEYLLRNSGGVFSVELVSGINASWILVDGDIQAINFTTASVDEILVRIYGSNGHALILSQTTHGLLAAGLVLQQASLSTGTSAAVADLDNDGLEEVLLSGVSSFNTMSSGNVSLQHGAVKNFAPKAWAGSDGASHASIKIEIPQELGPAPSLSIDYSSNAGNGPLGLGFNLSGVSKVHYCNPLADVDGTMATRAFEGRLCIDGQRLVKISGARLVHGATYMTEISNHSRITYQNNSSQNQYVMQTKGGVKFIFGHARKHDQNTTQTVEWYLSRVEDEFGNGYSYSYKYRTQHQYLPLLETITYGTQTINLNWESRFNKPDQNNGSKSTSYDDEYMGHIGGATTLIRDRLAGITVNRNSTAIRSYNLAYGVNDNGQSQLENVTVCGLSSTCVGSSFDWFGGDARFTTPSQVANLTNKYDGQKPTYLDINGDGFIDLMYPSSGASSTWLYRLGSASGFGNEIDTGISFGAGNFSSYATPIKMGQDFISGLIVGDTTVTNEETGEGAFLACENDEAYHLYSDDQELYVDLQNTNRPGEELACSSVETGFLTYKAGIRWKLMHAEFQNGAFQGFNLTSFTSGGQDELTTMGNRLKVADINADGESDIVIEFEREYLDMLAREEGGIFDHVNASQAYILFGNSRISNAKFSNVRFTSVVVDEQLPDRHELKIADKNNDGVADLTLCPIEIADGDVCKEIILNLNQRYLTAFLACQFSGSHELCDPYIDQEDVLSTTSQEYAVASNLATLTVSDVERYSPYYYLDMNADGIVDEAYMSTSGLKVSYKMGSGSAYQAKSFPNVSGDPMKVQFLDHNNDGLLDVLAEDQGHMKVYQAYREYASSGSNFRSIAYREVAVFLADSPSALSFVPMVYGAPATYAPVAGKEVKHVDRWLDRDLPTILDFDGDGISDVLYTFQNTLYATQKQAVGGIDFVNINKLKEITDSFGNKTKFTYKNSQLEPNTENDDVRFPYVNIANTTGVVDTLKYGNASEGYRTKSYTYKGAQFHVQGRGFMGYAERLEYDEDRGITNQEKYNQHFPLAGTLKNSKRYKTDTQLISAANNTWEYRSLDGFNSQVILRYLNIAVQEKYNLGTDKVGYSTRTSAFDDFGNTLSSSVINRHGSGNYINQVATVNEYQHLAEDGTVFGAEKARWRVGFLTKSTTTYTSVGNNRIQDNKVQVVALVPKGVTNLVETKTDFSGSDQELIHTYSYDQNGVLIGEQLSSGDDALHSIESRTQYSNSNLQHSYLPRSVTNATGQSASIVYDSLWHKAASQTDVYGLTSKQYFDDWGAPYKTVSPEGVVSFNLTNLCTSNCPPGGYYYSTQMQMHETLKGHLAPPQYTYFDKLGRVLREETLNANGQRIFQDYIYDEFNRLTDSSLPYISGSTIQWVEYKNYDDLDRPQLIEYPDGGSVTSSYIMNALGVIHVKNTMNKLPDGSELTHTVRTRVDAVGQINEVLDQGTYLRTTYEYDGLGNLLSADLSYLSNSKKRVTAQYNDAGLKTQVNDPDTGTYNYEYDPLGLMRKQTDAVNDVYLFTYDKLNNQILRTLNGNTDATWVYSDSKPGLLTQKYKTGFSESYLYDDFLRPIKVDTQLKELVKRQFKYEYDAAGRSHQVHYPSGFSVQSVYNNLGYQTGYKKPKSNEFYWQADSMDAFGNWTGERLGNDIQTSRDFDPASGLLQQITSTKSQSGDIQNLSYTWDSNGNLKSRSQAMGASTVIEEFGYDVVNRLRTATTTGLSSGTRTLSYVYDAMGNMLTKSDISEAAGMVYGTPELGPTRLQSVTQSGEILYNYVYDNKGNVTKRGSTSIAYTAANKPSRIFEYIPLESLISEFEYDTEEQRFYQNEKINYKTARETYYYGAGYEEIFDTDPETQIKTHKQKAYVAGVLIHTFTQSDVLNGKVTDIQYLHHDHQGSTQAITNSNGEILQTLAYDPFGRARQSNWENIDSTNGNPDWVAITLGHTSTGYTGHEMLGDFELIHMGGRIYDPLVGRMLSADPFIQAPYNGQSYNRYSYTINNPMTYVDPSGYLYTAGNSYLHESYAPIPQPIWDQNLTNLATWHGVGVDQLMADIQIGKFQSSINPADIKNINPNVGPMISPIVQVASASDVLLPSVQAMIGGEMLAGDGFLGAPDGVEWQNPLSLIYENFMPWLREDVATDEHYDNFNDVSRITGDIAAGAAARGNVPAATLFGGFSFFSGLGVIAMDAVREDPEAMLFNVGASASGSLSDRLRQDVVKFVPGPMKTPTRVYMSTVEVARNEIFYHAGDDGNE